MKNRSEWKDNELSFGHVEFEMTIVYAGEG